jgi:threonine/homoserine/homoserine lactone efflux protein
VVGFALAGSPGPNTLSLAATGAAFGARRGLSYLLGLLVGMIAVMLVTATGVVGLLLAVPGATPVVAAIAAAYFMYLAFRIATAPPLAQNDGHDRQPSFSAGVFLSLINPKAYAAMAALFSGFVLIREHLALDITVKVIVLAAIIMLVNVSWLSAGAALTRWFREPRTNRVVNVTFAVLLVVSLAVAILF